GGEEVVGEVRELVVGVAVGDLDGFADAAVQGDPAGGGEVVIEGAPDEAVAEAVPGNGPRQLGDEPGGESLVEGGEERCFGEVGGGGDHRGFELEAGDSSDGQDLAGGGGEAAEPPADHLPHSVGDSEVADRPDRGPASVARFDGP